MQYLIYLPGLLLPPSLAMLKYTKRSALPWLVLALKREISTMVQIMHW
jgi:hypothetical protein